MLAGKLHLLVFQQTPHQLGARILTLVRLFSLLAARQQHARLDVDQHRRHQQYSAASSSRVARAAST